MTREASSKTIFSSGYFKCDVMNKNNPRSPDRIIQDVRKIKIYPSARLSHLSRLIERELCTSWHVLMVVILTPDLRATFYEKTTFPTQIVLHCIRLTSFANSLVCEKTKILFRQLNKFFIGFAVFWNFCLRRERWKRWLITSSVHTEFSVPMPALIIFNDA